MLNDIELRPNKQNWASMVEHLLSRLGFLEVWNAQWVGNIGNFLCTFKTRVQDICVQVWHARLENSTRARFYINVAKFQFQKYLDLLKIEKYRKNLCKLRVSSHRLEVETGRWAKSNRILLDNRKCCLNKDLRKTYIKRYYWQRPNMPKLIEPISFEKGCIIKKILAFALIKHLKWGNSRVLYNNHFFLWIWGTFDSFHITSALINPGKKIDFR